MKANTLLKTPFLKYLLFFGVWSASSNAFAAPGDTRLCNDGSASLYFATVGEYEGLLGSKAMVQGLVEVAPDHCADLVPSGINKVILAFFKKDSRGFLTNTLVPAGQHH